MAVRDGASGGIEIAPESGEADSVRVVIRRNPFSIVIRGRDGRAIWRAQEVAADVRGGQVEGWRLRFEVAAGEAFYGFGERFNAVNQRGETVKIWGVDAGMGSFLGIRSTAYKNSPFFLSSRGYGLFWDTSYRLDCDMGASRTEEGSIVADGPVLDVYVLCHADPKVSLGYLCGLTGRPLLPPRWAFEPWMGREAGAWRRGSLVKGDAVGEMLSVVKRFEALDIPHGGLYAEGPSAGDARLYQGLAGRNVRVFGWRSPTPDQWAKAVVRQLRPKDYEHVLVHRADGSVFTVPRGCFRQGLPYFDFTHPEALKYIRMEFRDWLRLGLAGTMVDDADDVSIDSVFHNGQTGRRMHNRYCVFYHKVFNQVFREARGDDFVLFARSAWPGSQQYVCYFAGDHPESFDGLESVIHGGLSFGASGFPFWGSDIGGLLPRPFEPLTEAVYNRWVAFAAMSPLMRAHGCSPREPWRFGERAVRVYRFYAWLRMNLLPAIYSLAIEAHRTGVPLMRIGYLEFPDDVAVREVQRSYCLGPDLWVVPVTSEEQTCRVYVPGEGVWTDLRTGETFNGGTWVDRPADYGQEPLMLRPGAILPAELEDRSLAWGRSMRSGKRLCLVASANDANASERRLHVTPQRTVTVSARRSDGEWVLSCEEPWGELGGFVVYGVRPQRVVWCGREIAEAGGGTSTATSPGERWWYDSSQRAAKVVVGSGGAVDLRIVF
ncbi:MAG: glycoside hydrolase family 31 protein [Phycisphaerae bacterium]|nr:glycoside hydrolase family 31 protein [Phycisphaerae bacterium]